MGRRPELRRQVKKRFDELGIEIPFPQRVVHHVYDGETADGVDAQAKGREVDG